MTGMMERSSIDLRATVQSLQKDVESKATTIKHLQSALDAKSQTINILSKANKSQHKDDGGSLEKYIQEAVEDKCRSKLAAKDEEVNRLMELLHDLEERQGQTAPASEPSALEVQQLQAELEELRRSSAPRRELEASEAERCELAEQLRALQQQAQQSAAKAEAVSQQLSQFREYQSKAFELKSANDALGEQLEAVNEEIQHMQTEHKEEVDQLQKELSTLQSDRQAHHQAVAAQIDSKVKQIRLSLESERRSLEQELEDAKESARVQLQAVSAERDHLQLRLHAQEVEVQALRDVVGEGRTPEAQKPEASEASEASEPEPRREQVERAKALREQSQFAFDEMANRLTEIREEGETERKRLQADLDQQLKQRAAALLEVQNERDSLQTRAEALEQANKSVSLQRDELARQLRERERSSQELSDELEEQQEALKTQQQRHGVLSLVHALQRSTVLPAFSLLRRALSQAGLGNGGLPERHKTAGLISIEDADSLVDTSTGDGMAGIDDLADDSSPEASDEEPDETYGTDDRSQQELAEMMKANTFESLFAGADTVSENATSAAGELQEHVANIMTSLEFFPQMYSSLMQELDRRGFGKELRKFLLLMQRAIGRSIRLANTMAELAEKHANVNLRLKNLLRSKYLEWHLKSLRMSGQHEVLLRFQKNQMAAMKADYDDVLDQYGDQCEQNRQEKQRANDLQTQLEDARLQMEKLKDSEVSLRNNSLEESLREVREELDAARKQIQALEGRLANETVQGAKAAEPQALQDAGEAAAPGPKAKGKGKKGPGPAGQKSGELEQPEPPQPDKAEPGSEPAAGTPSATGKGKGKKGPGPPPTGDEASDGQGPTSVQDEASAGASAPPPGKAKGKSKKGPGPPPASQPDGETPASSGTEPPTSTQETSEEGPAKPKGKGKKGPGPPPPSTASISAEGTADAPPADVATPAPWKGKGKKGPPMPQAKGGQEPAGNEEGETTQTADAPAKGKGKPAAPPKGGAKGKSKGKVALPDVDPGPEPPKDLVGKKFHWTSVAGNRFAGSMFQQILESLSSKSGDAAEAEAAERAERAEEEETKKPKLQKLSSAMLSKLTGVFFKKKDEPADAEAKEQKETKKKTVAQCLNSKKSQAVEIFLNGCGVNINHVRRCVLDLEPAEKSLSAEHLEKVLDLFPKGEELQELVDFKKSNDPAVLPWARAEDFLIQLMDISDFKVRAECCLTRGMFAAECDEAAKDLDTLHQALTAACNCEHLRKIFAVVMQIGNYLNHGTNKGAQRGFSLDTLPLLSRVEGFEGKAYSLLRFIMDEVEPDVCRGALQELELCEAASKLDFDECVRRLSEMEKRLAALSEALGPAAEGDGADKTSKFGDRFETVMRAFLDEAQLRVSKLRQQTEQVQELSKTCCDLFAEKPRTPAPETLGKLAAFRKDMEAATRANLLWKAKMDSRKKKEQAKAQKAVTSAALEVKPSAPEAFPEAGAGTSGAGSREAVPEAAASPPKMKTMQVKIPERPACMIHASRGPAVSSSLLKEALVLATSNSNNVGGGGRLSIGPAAGRQTLGALSSLDSRGRATMGNPMGLPGGRRTLDSSLEGLSGVLNHLRATGQTGGDVASGQASSREAPPTEASPTQASSQASSEHQTTLQAQAPLEAAVDEVTSGPSGQAASGTGKGPGKGTGKGTGKSGLKGAGKDAGKGAGGEKLKVPSRGGLSADFLKISNSGRVSLGPRSAAALAELQAAEEAQAAKDAAERLEAAPNGASLAQKARQERKSQGVPQRAEPAPELEDAPMPPPEEPRPSLAEQFRKAKGTSKRT